MHETQVEVKKLPSQLLTAYNSVYICKVEPYV
jgi:hypothetical protein